jgi:hypothetical protein
MCWGLLTSTWTVQCVGVNEPLPELYNVLGFINLYLHCTMCWGLLISTYTVMCWGLLHRLMGSKHLLLNSSSPAVKQKWYLCKIRTLSDNMIFICMSFINRCRIKPLVIVGSLQTGAEPNFWWLFGLYEQAQNQTFGDCRIFANRYRTKPLVIVWAL